MKLQPNAAELRIVFRPNGQLIFLLRKIQNPALFIVCGHHLFKMAMPHAIARGGESNVIHRNSEVHAVTHERLFEIAVGTGAWSAALWLRIGRGDFHFTDDLVEVGQAEAYERNKRILAVPSPVIGATGLSAKYPRRYASM